MVFEDRNSPEYRPGEPVSLTEIRELDRLVRDMAAGTVTGPAGLAGNPRDSFAVPAPPGFWARITGQPSLSQPFYAFIAVVDDGTGAGWVTAAYAVTPSQLAFEISGNTAVPAHPTAGAIVWIMPGEANGGESWRFTYCAVIEVVVANASIPDASNHYDGSVLVVDPATGNPTTHESCWLVRADPSVPLVPFHPCLGRLVGTYSGRNVYTVGGVLVTMLDSGSPRLGTVELLFRKPTFLLDQPSIGQARVKLDWGTDIQPVGTVNFEGTSERAARSNHVHALVTLTTENPPPGSVGNTIVYNKITNQFFIYVPESDGSPSIGWVPFCPCPGWSPPSGSGSGTGSGVGGGGTGGFITSCGGGVPVAGTLFAKIAPGGTAGCECAAPFVTIPLTHSALSGYWLGSGTVCGKTIDLQYGCYSDPSWSLTATSPGNTFTTTDPPASYTPFRWPNSPAAGEMTLPDVCSGSMAVSIGD
jgi:hypothetical protein